MTTSLARNSVASAFLSLALQAACAQNSQVFGLTIGEPLDIPACQSPSAIPERPATGFCLGRIGAVVPGATFTGRAWLVAASDTYPAWVQTGLFSGVRAIVIDGRLAGVEVQTYGTESHELVVAALNNKYGKPMKSTTASVGNAVGGVYTTHKMRWVVGTVQVEYQSIMRSVKEGMVIIGTEAALAHLRRLNAEALREQRDGKAPL